MTLRKNITGIITWLVTAVTGMVVILIPLCLFFFSYQSTVATLEAEAEINADIFTQIVSSNPEYWEFEHIRLTEYLVRRPKERVAELRRIVNIKNEVVSESADDLHQPLITRSADIMDSGIIVGRIEISRSLRPLLAQTSLVFLLVLPFALGVFFVLRILPIRTILLAETSLIKTNEDLDTTNKLLQEEIVKCQRVETELHKLNEELEARVVERTLQLETQIDEQRQVERALVESEEKFRNFMENSPIGLCITDLSGHIQYVNRKIEEKSGWTREELLSRNAFTVGFFDEETKQVLLERLAARLSGDVPRITEILLTCKDGSRLWIDLRTKILHKKGVPSGLQLAFIDITERKEAEEALAESEKKYRLLTEKMTDIVWIQDMNLRTVHVSPSIEAVLGFTPEERVAQDVHEQLTPESMSVALDVMEKELALEEQGQADPERKITIELEYYHKDGSTRWLENIVSGIRNDNGILTGLHGVSRDITTRKQMEDALKENEALLRNYFENAPDGIYMSDLQGKFIYGNLRSEEIIGYSREELIGKNYLELNVLSENSLDKAIQLLQASIEGKSTGPDEIELINKDGRHIPVEINTSVFQRGGEKITLGFVRDITDRKQAERDLQNARDQLLQSEKLAAMGRLSAGVAHEIFNPVSIISMELQMLQMTESLSPKVVKELNICMDQINRIVAITENLKQFSRISDKKKNTADINDIITHVLSLYATQLKIEEIETEVQCQPELPLIAMDKEKIEQVILNLITNAVAAMEGKENKVLRITTEREGVFRNNERLKIMIADTGTGIKGEHMSKIFDPFFTTKGQGQGTGLGLSISYGIIHDHGGKIWAENNKWGGASFYVMLPAKAEIEKN